MTDKIPDNQGALFTAEDLDNAGAPVFGPAPAGDLPAKAGQYTGALVVRDRRRYEEILRLSAEGLGIHRIAKLLKCSAHTVQMARERDGDWIALLKKRMAGQYRAIASVAADGLLDALLNHPDKVSARDRAIIIGVMQDKADQAEAAARDDGDPHAGAGHDEYADLLHKLRGVEGAAMRLAAKKDAPTDITLDVEAEDMAPAGQVGPDHSTLE